MNDRPDPLVELLADHDAGLPVDPSVPEHPRARPVLDALAATRAELAAAPAVPVPPELAARWTTALTEAARADRSDPPGSPPSTPGSPAAAPATAEPLPTIGPARPSAPASRGRSRPPARAGRSRRARPAVLAGALLVVVLVVAGVVNGRGAPPTVAAAQLGGIARAAVGVAGAGPFADPARREACLRALAPAGLAPDAPLAGAREVVFEGRPGFVLLLITGRLATFRALVVTPDCDALLADTVVGP